MFYKMLADIVVLTHFVWILFLFFGGFWGVRNKAVKIFHISGLFFAFLIQIFDWYCPLTHLEVLLRSKHNPAITYTGSFIIYYVEKIVYIEISHSLLILFTILLCGINAWLYLKKGQIISTCLRLYASRQGRQAKFKTNPNDQTNKQKLS